MKPTSDTEMDLLLRRHARRQTVARDEGESPSSREVARMADETSVHLDADELSAFAENALPPAARARYTSHLADCAACRRLVTSLALAAHTEVEEKSRAEASEMAPARNWRDWLSAFFAPPVLRYAVPAILLFAVTVIAFIALRNRNEPSYVAQNEPQQNARTNAAAQPGQAEQAKTLDSTSNSSATTVPFDSSANSNAQSSVKVGSNVAGEAQSQESQANRDGIALNTQPAPPPPPAAKEPSAPREEDRTRDAEEDARVAATPPSDATGLAGSVANNRVADNKDEAARVQAGKEKKADAPANPTIAGASADKFGAMESNNGPPPALASKSASQPAGRGRSRRADAPKTEQQRAATEGDDSTETRRAGGRQFRRQGGVWVDTAYNSSRQTTSVARGSEQYRALVADEPGIRTIAEQLGGEVIVVWKGRAYRIH